MKHCLFCQQQFSIRPTWPYQRYCSRSCSAQARKPMRSIAERFEESYIPEPNSGCWLWLGNTNADGYGQMKIKFNGKWVDKGAHRISWMLAHGAFPTRIQTLHECDNPPCVNPAHLFIGTHTDNMQDRSRKGRGNHPSGERNKAHKLTRSQVDEIRQRYAAGGIYQYQLAAEYGVVQGTIGFIVRGENWR